MGKFSRLTHHFLHLPTSATDFHFDVPPLFLSVFKDESRLLNSLHLALPAKLQVTNILCAAFLLHLDKAQNLWTLFLPHALAAFSRLRGRLFFVLKATS